MLRSIYPERYSIHEGNINTHSRFQRSQLFQFMLYFKGAGRQGHKTLQSRPPVGINTDMMVHGAALILARKFAAEHERAGDIPFTPRCQKRLDHGGIAFFPLIGNFTGKGGDVDRRVFQWFQHRANQVRVKRRHIPLKVNHNVIFFCRVECLQRFKDSV